MSVPIWMFEHVERLGWVLVHFFWQGAVLGGGLWLARFLLGKQSTHLRYLVLCAGLAACALAPCLTWVVLSKGSASRTAPPMVTDSGTMRTLSTGAVTLHGAPLPFEAV